MACHSWTVNTNQWDNPCQQNKLYHSHLSDIYLISTLISTKVIITDNWRLTLFLPVTHIHVNYSTSIMIRWKWKSEILKIITCHQRNSNFLKLRTEQGEHWVPSDLTSPTNTQQMPGTPPNDLPSSLHQLSLHSPVTVKFSFIKNHCTH